MKEIKCEKCGQEIKQPKPDLKVGQKLYCCLGWDNNKMKIHEVAEGTNKKSLLLKCFDGGSLPDYMGQGGGGL